MLITLSIVGVIVLMGTILLYRAIRKEHVRYLKYKADFDESTKGMSNVELIELQNIEVSNLRKGLGK